MKTCIVVLNYNDSDRTLQFINDVKDYKVLDEIVIVDNCSTDKSYSILKKLESDKITVLKSSVNKGYGAGNNVGCKYLMDKYKNPIIFISNPDIIVSEEVFKKIEKVLSDNKEIAIAAPVVMQDGGEEKGWKLLNPLRGAYLNLPFIYRKKKQNRDKKFFYSDNYYNDKFSFVDVVTGCFFAIKGKYIKEINYFDENIFLYNEEEVIAKKLQKIKKKTVIVNDLKVIHEHSVSISKSFSSLKKIKTANKSKIYYQKKYNDANILEIFLWHVVNVISIIKESIKIIINR